jgi:CHAD domain-containing protein
MPKRKFYRRWKRRFEAGLAEVKTLLAKCLRAGDPESIHNLRVTLRRARMLALVGTPVLGKAQATGFRQWALKVTAALGGVRDYDVILEWLNIHSPAPKRDQLLRQNRVRAWRLTRPKVLALSPIQWKQLRRWKPSAVRPGKLGKRFSKQCASIRASLDKDAARFHHLDEAALHDFRRRLRRLRYLRELALSRREQKSDPALGRLVMFQEALGEVQNCSVVRAFFSTHPRFKSQTEPVRLAKAQERQWLKRAEEHLAVFLRQTGGS